jgi:hypothetical protein
MCRHRSRSGVTTRKVPCFWEKQQHEANMVARLLTNRDEFLREIVGQ